LIECGLRKARYDTSRRAYRCFSAFYLSQRAQSHRDTEGLGLKKLKKLKKFKGFKGLKEFKKWSLK
jgi:hypothetical protein